MKGGPSLQAVYITLPGGSEGQSAARALETTVIKTLMVQLKLVLASQFKRSPHVKVSSDMSWHFGGCRTKASL